MLAVALRRTQYPIAAILVHGSRPRKETQSLGRKLRAPIVIDPTALSTADLVWFCVPDGQIAKLAATLADKIDWKRKLALHSSGALTSRELDPLRQGGAAVASVHPMMTFVRGSQPSLANVPFAIEGDAAALRDARRIIQDLGGKAYSIRPSEKAAYHAWGTFASPLFTALLVTTERVAKAAGVSPQAARRRIVPILLQTLANYASFGAAGAFSGPLVRGDIDIVKRHLDVLQKHPVERDVYRALAHAASLYLPTKNKAALRKVLGAAK